jgi:hypothetical protein
MAAARKSVRRSAQRHSSLTQDFAELMRALSTLVDPYRPEQHYMRGPGPKWHAKHDRAAVEAMPVPALVRVKA